MFSIYIYIYIYDDTRSLHCLALWLEIYVHFTIFFSLKFCLYFLYGSICYLFLVTMARAGVNNNSYLHVSGLFCWLALCWKRLYFMKPFVHLTLFLLAG